jgi:hypothetical protein
MDDLDPEANFNFDATFPADVADSGSDVDVSKL